MIVKTVKLVKEILKHVKLNAIIDGVLQVSQCIKYRAVKQLVSDIFWDKRAEVDLCRKSESICKQELKEL